MGGIEHLINLMKIPVRYFVGIATVTGFILLAPNSMIERFGLLQYREKGKLYFAIAFFILSAIIIASGFDHAERLYRGFFADRAREKRLHSLTDEEIKILSGYITEKTRTCYLDINDGVVSGLVIAKIIYRSSNISSFFTTFAYNIQPWAWEYLNKNRHLLNLE